MKKIQTKQHVKDSGDNRTAAHSLSALVVDDDPVMRKMVATMLRINGFTVYTADDGVQALLKLSTTPCSVVLSDYEMPFINGYQLGNKIKSKYPGTRVVIMTGLRRSAVLGMMGDSAIDGWLFKPFSLAEIKTLLWRIVPSAMV
ncbi:MAG: response regulator [Desulfobacteraceae bacterium]|jgi:CheY-like chemotaxis protein